MIAPRTPAAKRKRRPFDDQSFQLEGSWKDRWEGETAETCGIGMVVRVAAKLPHMRAQVRSRMRRKFLNNPSAPFHPPILGK
jgi:hypothetical protein